MRRLGEHLPEIARRDLEKLQGPGAPALTSPSPHQGRGGARRVRGVQVGGKQGAGGGGQTALKDA